MRYLAVLLLAGCASVTPIDTSRAPPADWPTLQESVVRVSQEQIARTCTKTMAGYETKACSLIYFSDRRCVIQVADTVTTALNALVDHERQHCRGYDHPGDSSVRNAWERYKARAAR